ncbi:hypothetical protein [Anaplasma phagocytophilum]|uniref:hypothetical protein n=1 Tax=Anaplasma phagocytophilum TaxID=948 RepID=UPI00053376CA|nr:hypothetical protein [Anaplasma phagocytophilum]KDB57294.1 hypothetical protein P030_05035 [Anaplasma phagocytophilum str. CRT35]
MAIQYNGDTDVHLYDPVARLHPYIARTMEASGADICSEEFRNAVLRSISQYEDLEGVLYALAHIIESAVFSLGEARGCVASSATAYRNVFIGKALKVLSLCKGLVGIAAGKGFIPKESSLLLHVGLLYTCLAHLDRVSEYREDVDTADLGKAITKTINAIYIVYKRGDVINVTNNWNVEDISCIYGLGIGEVSLVHRLIEKTLNVSRRTMKGVPDITALVKVTQGSSCEVGCMSALWAMPELLRDAEHTRGASVSHKLDAVSISAENNEQIPIATLRYATLTHRLRALVSRLPIPSDTREIDSCLLMRFMASTLFASGDIEGCNVLKDGAGLPKALSNLIAALAENDLAPTYSRC